MATYVMLVLLTGQGVQNMKNSAARVDAAKDIFKDLGAEVKDVYLLMGHYDMALVVEAPNYETMAKAALSMDSLGSMRTETMRAFTEGEYRKLISDMP